MMNKNNSDEKKNMIKRYWIPILMGAVTAVIGFLITYADLTIYVGTSAHTGLPLGYDGREIFMTLCAALGGPLAAVIAVLQFPFIGIHLSLPATGVAVIMLDRLTASLTVVFLYRYMYAHIKRLPLFLLFWAVTIWEYYSISFNIEVILGCILSDTSILATYQDMGLWALTGPFLQLEPPLTYLFTVLTLLSIPPRFRRPMWIQPNESVVEKKHFMKEEMA
jgi:hypothetical protein